MGGVQSHSPSDCCKDASSVPMVYMSIGCCLVSLYVGIQILLALMRCFSHEVLFNCSTALVEQMVHLSIGGRYFLDAFMKTIPRRNIIVRNETCKSCFRRVALKV